MRNLLGTHMGHCSIYTMVKFLQTCGYRNDAQLLRGAVFHITMALWSAKRVDKLKCTHTSILPAFLLVSFNNQSYKVNYVCHGTRYKTVNSGVVKLLCGTKLLF